MLLDPLGLYR